MKSFQDILQTQGYEFLNNLMNDYVLVYEKLNASTLSFKRTRDELHFYKGSDKEEITSINAALYTYFQKGIDYIRNVSLIFYKEFPENWLFSMKYFVDNKTNVIEYDYTPQNNLVLSFIDGGGSIIEDPDILKKWADRLQIDYARPLFQGFLSEFQKEKIYDFVKGKHSADVPFSQYIITLLNPSMNHSNYKEGFTGGVDSFIFKFYSPNSKKCVCAKIMDPYMLSILSAGDTSFEKNKYGNETEIILANFMAFLQTVDLGDIEVEGDSDDDRYLDLICKLFNAYIEKEKKLFSATGKKDVNENYTVNFRNIKNEETVKLLKENPNLVSTFQIIVGNFSEYKNPDNVNPLSLLNADLINMFNNEVDKIKSAASAKKADTKTYSDFLPKQDAAKTGEGDKVLNFEEFIKKNGGEIPSTRHVRPPEETPEQGHGGDGQEPVGEPASPDEGKPAKKEEKKEKEDNKGEEGGDNESGEDKKDKEKKSGEEEPGEKKESGEGESGKETESGKDNGEKKEEPEKGKEGEKDDKEEKDGESGEGKTGEDGGDDSRKEAKDEENKPEEKENEVKDSHGGESGGEKPEEPRGDSEKPEKKEKKQPKEKPEKEEPAAL